MKILLRHILIIAVLAAVYWAFFRFGIGCPVRYLTHIPCPACGSTRALLALARLDFAGYWQDNPAALLILIAVFVGVHANTRLFGRIKKQYLDWFVISLTVLIFGTYIVRLVWFTIP